MQIPPQIQHLIIIICHQISTGPKDLFLFTANTAENSSSTSSASNSVGILTLEMQALKQKYTGMQK